MPSTQRRIHTSLIERLEEEPYRFEFFQAVRVLLRDQRSNVNDDKDRDILGQIIQFRSSVSLAFPPSEIEAIEFESQDSGGVEDAALPSDSRNKFAYRRVTITPSFIGLTGPMGVMPRHYTHYVAERELYHRDTATRAFLDIFTSRAVALFYQAWLKYRLHLQYEADRKNRFLPMILSLAGLGLPGTRERLAGNADGISDESLAYYSAALRERPQSAQWFSRVVTDYFRVHCKLEQFIGQWLQLPEDALTKLGQANCGLGVSTFSGARVWDRNTKVRLTIGPLRKARFDEFLPGAAAAENLKKFFRLMVGATFDCHVQLILDRRDLTPASLDTRLDGTKLGWNGWIAGPMRAADSHETSYLISAADTI